MDSPQLTVSGSLHYTGNRNMKVARSSENSLESARCCVLIHMLNLVSCTQNYL